MKRIVISKQADHDADLFAFWMFWYTRVFPADDIVVMPIHTPASETRETCRFYGARPGVRVMPVQMDTWNAQAAWRRQIEVARERASGRGDVLVVLPDADMFLEPVSDADCVPPRVLFRRVHIAADEAPDVERIDSIAMACAEYGCTEGFCGRGDVRLNIAGHYTPAATDRCAATEFHFVLRGFDRFLRKVRAVHIAQEVSPTLSIHWRAWARILAEEGEAGLRREYEREKLKARDGGPDDAHVERFRQLVRAARSPSGGTA